MNGEPQLTTDEFAQHIINAFADYANVHVANHVPYRRKHDDGASHAALLIELDGGQSFHIEVTPA